MKKLLFIAAIFLTSFTIPVKDDFCDGWAEGYCEGYRDVIGQKAVCPVTPVCPVPGVDQNTYKGGYNLGFKAGTKAAKF